MKIAHGKRVQALTTCSLDTSAHKAHSPTPDQSDCEPYASPSRSDPKA